MPIGDDGLDGVERAVLAPLDAQGRRTGGPGVAIECDTIVLGVGTVPVIELTDAIGCRNAFLPERGGHVPITDANGLTSVPGVYAVRSPTRPG